MSAGDDKLGAMNNDDSSLLTAVRQGDSSAWETLIRRYEGRLLAFIEIRLNDRTAAQDVLQETFLGFLNSLPNYDEKTPLESFLFAIASHKLTDTLRRNGRRPAIPIHWTSDSGVSLEPVSKLRKASSMARSAERNLIVEKVFSECMKGLVQSWLSRGEFERLMCIELLFSLGLANQDVARKLGISEQAVANHKSFVVQKLKAAATIARLRDVDWTRLAGE